MNRWRTVLFLGGLLLVSVIAIGAGGKTQAGGDTFVAAISIGNPQNGVNVPVLSLPAGNYLIQGGMDVQNFSTTQRAIARCLLIDTAANSFIGGGGIGDAQPAPSASLDGRASVPVVSWYSSNAAIPLAVQCDDLQPSGNEAISITLTATVVRSITFQ